MTLLILRRGGGRNWSEALARAAPDLAFRVWPDTGPVAAIDSALVWNPPPGELKRLPNLKVIISMGAGVDHLLGDPALPPEVPIVRLVDPTLAEPMAESALLAVLRFHRQAFEYARLQAERRWEALPMTRTRDLTVGVLGLGAIGGDVAAKFLHLGFPVRGWSRTRRSLSGIQCFAGSEELLPFLAGCRVLVCVLPLTAETRDLLNARTLGALPRGAYFVNIARGALVVEEDLLALLDSGHLAGAALDVFHAEPLPETSRFWSLPNVVVTPHIAAITDAEACVHQVVDAVRRVRSGSPLFNLVERARGY
ncbi:MAG: glyoxylate/hydroxypyruvate reductase A [Alphaproteobacteria bacterium]|nr:glyoxylate/hydroxypyruvate reductase A [Alphaproteobacteria bacterium]